MEINPPSHNDDRSQWQTLYEQGKTGWDRGEPNPALSTWIEQGIFAAGTRTLIPGCGRGHEVVELARRGLQVTALDFAHQPIAELQATLRREGLAAEVKQEDAFAYQDEPFDIVYEQTFLCAISPDRRTEYERRLSTWLKPNGRLCCLFLQTEATAGPPFCCPIQEMQELFDRQRWHWSEEQRTIDHPAGLREIAVLLTRS